MKIKEKNLCLKKSKIYNLLFCIIVFLLCCIMIYFVNKKNGFHADEMFSYGSSNYKYDNVFQPYGDRDYINKFIIGADLNEVVFSATPAQSKNEKDVMLIDFKSKRETDTNDTLFVHKSKFATRNLTLHVDYNPDEMDVTPAGFCFMDKDMIGNRMKIDYFPRSLKIRFKNWILPGNGVMFNITPKK